MEIGYLVLFNVITAGFWSWVCFVGGAETWCDQIRRFWRGGAYTRLKPWHLKLFMTIFLLSVIGGDIGVIMNRL